MVAMLDELKQSGVFKPIARGILAAVDGIEHAENGAGAMRSVPARAVRDVLTFIESRRHEKRVSQWLGRACREFAQVSQLVDSELTDGGEFAALSESLGAVSAAPFLYEWLRSHPVSGAQHRATPKNDAQMGSQRSRRKDTSSVGSTSDVACQIVADLRRTQLTLAELHRIQIAFEGSVIRLPSFTAKEAAEFIGVTVDRVHRMAALGEIDTFFIRRRIPKSEIRRRGKGGERGTRPEEENPMAPEVTAAICRNLEKELFNIPQLMEIQAELLTCVERVSVSLKEGIEQMGFSEVYVHSLLRRGELLSFGLPRLIPRSEAERLRRDPHERHLGRPRISESGGS
jgi:hypothetical protein